MQNTCPSKVNNSASPRNLILLRMYVASVPLKRAIRHPHLKVDHRPHWRCFLNRGPTRLPSLAAIHQGPCNSFKMPLKDQGPEADAMFKASGSLPKQARSLIPAGKGKLKSRWLKRILQVWVAERSGGRAEFVQGCHQGLGSFYLSWPLGQG